MQVDAEKNPQTGAAPVTEIDRKGARLSKQYWVMAIKAMITYLIIIWIPACYILGSTYEQKHHVKNMKMIIVDFDQSGIGLCLSTLYDLDLQYRVLTALQARVSVEHVRLRLLQRTCRRFRRGLISQIMMTLTMRSGGELMSLLLFRFII